MKKDAIEQLKAGVKLQTSGRFAEAEKIYLKMIEQDPENFDALQLQGLIHLEKNEHEHAIHLIEKAIKLQPNAAAFHHNISGIYRVLGRLKEAETGFRRALELKPDYGEAYQGLAEMVKFKEGDPLLGQVRAQLASKNLDKAQSCYLHFTAGKILDDIGEYEQAFEHYKKANKAASRSFSPEAFHQQVKDSLYVFSKERVEQLKGVGNKSARPVFIVGMPRSGTSLVEQILASHSKVYGAGELNDIKIIATEASKLSRLKSPYPNYLPGLTPNRYTELGASYLRRLEHIAGGDADRVIDKHPLNFMFVGLIFLLFPNAKVIHTQRNPLDTCLSCFFQNFTKGQDYSFDLGVLACFYNDYKRLMSHWRQLFGDRILHVEYEQLLKDQEYETHRLLSYSQLDFEEACLEFHQSSRVVKTASFLQVRQPLYHTSVNRWQNYRVQLREFAAAIGSPIDVPVTISPQKMR